MIRSLRWFAPAVAALFLCAPAAGSAAAPTEIRFGIASPATGNPPGVGGSAVAIAHKRGQIEKALAARGATVKWVFYKGAGPAVNEAIAAGQLDLAWQGDFPSMVGRSGGLDTKILMASGVRQNLYLAASARADVRSLADLRGKRVALFKGTNLQIAVGKLLEAHGLAEREVRFVNLDNPSAQAALVAGDIDAAFGGYELLGLAHRGLVRIVTSSKAEGLRYTRQTHVVVTGAFARAHPEVVVDVLKGLLEAARWAAAPENRAEVLRLWAEAGVPAEVWQEELAGQPLLVQSAPHFDGFLTAHYKDSAAAALRLRLLRRPVDVDAWIDRAPLSAALTALGLEGFWPRFADERAALARRP